MADVRFTAFVQGVNPQTGNGKDPELRYTQTGRPVLTFNSAETHSRKNQQGGYDNTGQTFRKVTVWNDAGRLAELVKPSMRVEIIGREETRSYDKQDGSKGYSFEVTADFLRVIPPKNQQDNQPQGGSFQNAAGQTGQGANSWGGQPQQQSGQVDPWASQSNGNYNWGNEPAQDTPPF